MKHKRHGIRYFPDSAEESLAWIDLKSQSAEKFTPRTPALIKDESSKGVGLLVVNHEGMEVGNTCVVQVGRLAPLQSEIRWKRKIEEGLYQIGFLYLE